MAEAKVIKLIGVLEEGDNIIKQGNTCVWDMPIKDQDGNLNLELALTAEIKFQVKREKEESAVEIGKTKDDGIEVLSGNDLGKLRITLLPADTGIAVRKYFMGLQLKWSDSEVYEVDIEIDGVETDIFRIKQEMVM